jgi:hypothetical protein
MLGSVASATTAALEIKRFTGGDSILILSASGIGLEDISGSTIFLPGPDATIYDDWYDFYVSGSTAATISLVKGIRVVLS